jgi:hypothetical protein
MLIYMIEKPIITSNLVPTRFDYSSSGPSDLANGLVVADIVSDSSKY